MPIRSQAICFVEPRKVELQTIHLPDPGPGGLVVLLSVLDPRQGAHLSVAAVGYHGA